MMQLGRKNKEIKEQSKNTRLENASPALQFANNFQIYGLLLLAVVIIGAGYFFYLGPKFSDLQDKADNFLPNRKIVLDDLRKIESKLKLLEQKFNDVKVSKQQELDNLLNFLPTEPDYGALFVQAEFLATTNDINLISIDVSRTLDRPLSERREPDSDQANLAAEQALELLPSNVRSVSINLNLGACTYDQFKAYLDSVEKNLRLYDIQTLSFESIDGETGDLAGFHLTLKSYYQVVQGNE